MSALILSWPFSALLSLWLAFLATFLVCVWTMFPAHAGHVVSSLAKLYVGFQLDVARAIMSSTGWLDVLTDKAVRCIPNKGHVRNSPTGVCSMFIRRFLICSTEDRIGTLPLSSFVEDVNACGDPTVRCMIVSEMSSPLQ